MTMNVILETNNYNILASGSVIVPYREYLDIRLDDLNFRFSFHKEENENANKGRFEVKICKNAREEDILEIKLFNMNSSLFGTPSKMLQVGHFGGYVLYLQFSLVALKEMDNAAQQLLFYTFYQDKTKKD